jgi:pilus assembly protein CpaB
VTKLVLQNVQVLAAGESIQRDSEGKPQSVTVITLLVSPDDAEKLTLSSTEGLIQLALRNVMDQDSVRTAGSDVGSLVSRRPPPRPAPAVKPAVRRAAPPAPATQVETYRGTEREVKSF